MSDVINKETYAVLLSESVFGNAISIGKDRTIDSDVEHIHVMTTDDDFDAVWLRAYTINTSARVDLNMILNPITNGTVDIDMVRFIVSIPPGTEGVPILMGHRFRRQSGSLYTIAAYVATLDIGVVKVIGSVVRFKQVIITP